MHPDHIHHSVLSSPTHLPPKLHGPLSLPSLPGTVYKIELCLLISPSPPALTFLPPSLLWSSLSHGLGGVINPDVSFTV